MRLYLGASLETRLGISVGVGFWIGVILFISSSITFSVASEVEPGPCLMCHVASADRPIHAIFNSVHAQLGRENILTDLMGKNNDQEGIMQEGKRGSVSDTCIACHGESEAHRHNPSVAPDTSFGPTWPSSLSERNETCLNCHAQRHPFWQGSSHQEASLACTDCHQSHTNSDPILRKRAEPQLCASCHTRVKAELHTPYRHPILEGKVVCRDCHDAHGSLSDASLVEATINDTCFQCHADKRGPFLFEHAPVSEDCTLCHQSHGSSNKAMTRVRAPFLCQQCHSAAFHPSQLEGGSGLPSGTASASLLGRSCMNCHTNIHGSNHPSGGRLTR